jgi:hypothetical protein
MYKLLCPESTLSGDWEYLSTFRSATLSRYPMTNQSQSLRRRLLVEEEAGQWRLRVPMMSRWLRKRG